MDLLNKVAQGIVKRDYEAEGLALVNKWKRFGLLEGLESKRSKHNMARLLENQAMELLRENTSMAGGQVEGFASVAFPIVRRVFGSLLAQDIVSVQPMSLPSGLIFFIDYQIVGTRLGYTANESVFGGNIVGQQMTGSGMNLTGAYSETGFYNLNNGYSLPTGTVSTVVLTASAISGVFGKNHTASSPSLDALCQFDADFSSGSTTAVVATILLSDLEVIGKKLNKDDLTSVTVSGLINPSSASLAAAGGQQFRRLTQWSGSAKNYLLVFFGNETGGQTPEQLATFVTSARVTVSFGMADNFGGTPAAGAANALGAVVGQTAWGLEADTGIPEIKLKVDSISVTARTRKLKAEWTPEAAQDLNAYHNLDAEVELTGVLSEYIGLEIDQEILTDLVQAARSGAGVKYWSRRPGTFVEHDTGDAVGSTVAVGPDFTGNVSMWYETLLERVNDLSATIQRKVLKGGANFIVTSPEVASIIEMTSGFRGSAVVDEDRGEAGSVKLGSINKKWDIYVSPYFYRNVMLVGRKGSSFLESGYVYSPYVPLVITPTVLDPESFIPRKACLTRYGKATVRPDMYGLVVILDMLG